MRDKKARRQLIATVIGQGTRIEGKIVVSSSIRIDGELVGEVRSEGTVVVGKSGETKGKVVSRNVDIAGRFEGDIQASELVELEPGCMVKGTIKTPGLVVHKGAIFCGQSVMAEEPVQSPKLGVDAPGLDKGAKRDV